MYDLLYTHPDRQKCWKKNLKLGLKISAIYAAAAILIFTLF